MPSSSGASASTSDPAPQPEATLLPHTGQVELCQLRDGTWVAVHKVSNQVVKIPVQDPTLDCCSLDFDEEGYGYAISSGSQADECQATSLEEHFTQGVYEDKDHNIFLDIGTDRAPSYHAVEDLEAMFVLKDLAMHIGQLSHRVVALAAVYTRPKHCGCSVLWSMPSLIKGLKLDLQGMAVWAWINKKFPVWEKHVAGMKGTAGYTQRGQVYNRKELPKDKTRNLPFHAVSTVALVVIIFRLMAGCRNDGGIESPRTRHGLAKFRDHLAHAACQEEWSMHVDLKMPWSTRPWQIQSPCKGDTTITIGPGGRLHFPAGLEQEQPEHFKMYIQDLGFHAGSNPTLGTYLHVLSGVKACRPLFQQMLSLLGRRLDGLLLHPALPAASARPLLQLKGPSTGPTQTDFALESKLVVHMGKCRAACGELLHLSLAVDKSRVGNLAIQNAVGCLPNNVAFVMPPQAIRAQGIAS